MSILSPNSKIPQQVSSTTARSPLSSDAQEQRDKRAFERWRRSLMSITGFGEKNEDAERVIEKYQCRQCETWRDNLMKNSPVVTFMLQNLKNSGCEVTKAHLQCMPCDTTRTGGFSPDYGILLCQNQLHEKSRLEETMVHEMIHLYDHCRFKVDWADCRHHACSEVRAASLSGDCKWSREIRRGFFTITKQHQACVKRRAILSVKQNPCCQGEGVAEKAVASVFESCFNDTTPFDEIYP